MKKLLILFLIINFTFSYAIENNDKIVFITLEHAKTEEQLAWGLMKRDYLPPNQGMLFHYSQPQKISVWMFNCFLDLSIAFLDHRGVILEIQELKAYPERMDPMRPIHTSKAMKRLYPPHDPILQFFTNRRITGNFEATYTLEMNSHWFEKNEVKPGDMLEWDETSGTGFFKTTK